MVQDISLSILIKNNFFCENKNKFYNIKKLVNKNTILFKFTNKSTYVQSGPDSYLNYPLKLIQIL